MLAHETSCSQVEDERLLNPWIERPVEVLEVLDSRDMGLFKTPGKEPISASVEFILDEQFQEVGEGELMMDGFLVAGIEGGSHAG
jgi:hypothetical protein